MIVEALDDLVAGIGVALPTVSATRDPQVLRANLAADQVAVFVAAPSPQTATMCGWQWSVPVWLVMPTTASKTDLDRALQVLTDLLGHLQEQNATPGPLPVGGVDLPGYQITTLIGD